MKCYVENMEKEVKPEFCKVKFKDMEKKIDKQVLNFDDWQL